jgi:hypothetical protein
MTGARSGRLRGRRRFAVAIAALALGSGAAPARADMEVSTTMPVARVLQCLQANAAPSMTVDNLHIVAKGGAVTTSDVLASVWLLRVPEGVRIQIKLSQPSNLDGSRYLLVGGDPEDQVYLYLPALGKVRRLMGGGPESEIAGTTVNVSDLRTLVQASRSASVSLSGSVKVQGRDADLLRFVPSIADSPWRRVLVSVDRTTCVVLRAEFQDGESTARTYDADIASLRQLGRYWYASRGVIRDLRRDTTATLELRDVTMDRKLSSGLFDPKSFYKRD